MSNLVNRFILLGVTGSIAAVKAPDLVRRLRESGAEVQVVLTRAAEAFVTPEALAALAGRPVRTARFDAEAETAMPHIELARRADLLLIAPATAHVLARLASGLADDLLGTLYLATRAPVCVVPAMNTAMWEHPATRANVEKLRARGVTVLEPACGRLACGEEGAGRMPEPAEIVAAAEARLTAPRLAGRRVLITAGPTREALDPVRFLGNRSSGRMGFALAEAAHAAGAEVVLVSGPVALPTPPGVTRIDVESAQEMHAAVMAEIGETDIFIGAAAVADYRPERVAEHKIKKEASTLQIRLVRNPDILAEVAGLKDAPFTVGFAAETRDVASNARKKRMAKGVDLICANRVGPGRGFEVARNALSLFWEGGCRELPEMDKRALAHALMETIISLYRQKHAARGRHDPTPSTAQDSG